MVGGLALLSRNGSQEGVTQCSFKKVPGSWLVRDLQGWATLPVYSKWAKNVNNKHRLLPVPQAVKGDAGTVLSWTLPSKGGTCHAR